MDTPMPNLLRNLPTWGVLAVALAATACTPASTAPQPRAEPAHSAPPVAAAPSTVTISVVGTSDLHGRLDRLPILGGFLANLRRVRAAHGGVVLVDAGDMFQGTLESNLNEGEAVIQGYNALGYNAAALGNHEFDYGPVGPRSTPSDPGDDPRGALAARARQARFPLLSANIETTVDHKPFALPGGASSTVVDAGGVRVGIIGVSTMETLRTTAPPNVRDLEMAPIAPAILREANRLRSQEHATVIVVAAHAAGACSKVDDPHDLSSCDDGEILGVAKALPEGTVDVIVGGHTHAAIAHEVHGIAVIQSWAQGRAFGRVDLTVDVGQGRVLSRSIQPPHELCTNGKTASERCEPGEYEGQPVVADASLAAALQPALDRAVAVRDRKLGVVVDTPMARQHAAESALGNLLADLMLEARPKADVALINGGGIRANLAAGPLHYGDFYAVFPFDNRFASTRMKASVLKSILAANASRAGGFLSISGVRAKIRCTATGLQVDLRRANGKPIRDNELLTVLASDFLATGGDGTFGSAGVEPSAFELESDPPIREALVEVLAKRGGHVSDTAYLPPGMPRIELPASRPVACGAAAK